MSAFYSTGPVAGLSSTLQAKFIQQKESSDEQETEPAEDSAPMQPMCDECEAEEKNNQVVQSKGIEDDVGDDETEEEKVTGSAIQMWSCVEYSKPTCTTQSKEDNNSAVQFMCPECEAEKNQNAGNTVQSQEAGKDTDSLDTEDEKNEVSIVQAQSADEDIKRPHPDEGNRTEDALQMMSCDHHPEPNRSIQGKEDDNSLVQLMCSECEDEQEQGEGDIVQSQNEEEEKDASERKEHEVPVQTKCDACEKEQESVQKKSNGRRTSKQSTQATATQGLKNANQPLPHKDRIQGAFGRHDVSGVRTEVGGTAGRASRRMGALAYASGDRIGFRHSPTLHLAAHEAAHTVQQRSGLKLPGNVGRPGDRWERHADQVADAVVSGESAEPILNEVVPASQTPPAVTSPSNGDGISGAVQHSLTSTATRRLEPPLSRSQSEGGGEVEAAGAGDADAEVTADAEAGGSDKAEGMEQQVEKNEQENNNPEEDCKKSNEGGGEEKSPCEEKKGGASETAPKKDNGPPPEKGRCYNAKSKKPPKGAKKPKKDAPSNKVEEESDVSCGKWDEPDDKCECVAKKKVNEQTGGDAKDGTVPGAQSSNTNPDENKGGNTESETAGAGDGEKEKQGAKAEAEGGSEGGGAQGAGEVSSEGSFAQGESTRDAAIAEFKAKTEEVERVPERTLRLSKGLRFASAQPSSAEDEAQRAMALKQIRGFMLRANSQIESAVSFVSNDAPARFGAMAESIKASIDMSMAEQKSVISARIAQARKAAIAGAAGARAAINAEYESSVTTVNTKTDAAIKALTQEHSTSTEAINKREGVSLKEINTRFQNGRVAHDNKGVIEASNANEIGEDWAKAYDKCRAGPGNNNVRNAKDGFWDGYLTVRRAKAQKKASTKTASGTAKNLKKTADRKGYKLREQRTQYRCAVITGAGEALKALDMNLKGLVAGMDKGRKGVLSGLEQTRDINLSSVQAALSSTMTGLDRQEREQRQAVNDSGYTQQVAIEQLAHQVSAGLASSVIYAMDSLEGKLKQLREQLTQGDAPPEDALNEMLASAEEGLGGGVGTLLEKMEEGAAKAETQLVNAGVNAAGALREVSVGNNKITSDLEQSFSKQMSTFTSAAKKAMSQLTNKHVQKVKESTTQGTKSMQKLVTGFVTTTEQIYTRIDSAIKTSLSELQTDLDAQKKGLPGKIAAEAWRAAEKEQPAWKAVVAIILIIIIIVVSVVLSVLTAGAFGPVAAILIGGIIGAVTAGLIQVINNWAAGEDLDKGVLTAMAIGFAGGILGGAFGAGASKVASVAVNRAITAGATQFTRGAINVSINLAGDMLGEAASQTFNYVVFGQKYNWQGFATAGGMSFMSTARGPGGLAGQRTPAVRGTGAVRGPGAARGPRAPLHAPTAGDVAIGMGLAGAIEGVSYLETGKFDVNRLATSFAGTAGGSWASRAGSAPSRTRTSLAESSAPTPTATPKTAAPKAPAAETPAATPAPKAPAAETPAATATPKAPVAEVPAATPAPKAPAAETPAATPAPKAPTAETPAATPTPKTPVAETPAATPTPKAPVAESPAATPTTKPKVPEAETPTPTARSKNEAEPNPRRSTHENATEIESGVVARKKTDDGHEVSVLKDGQIVTCSDCATIRMRYAEELSDPLNSAHRKELDRIEGISDSQAKVDAAVRLRNNLEVLRNSGISRVPAGATDGAALAKLAGMPDAPLGYHWAKQDGGVSIRRNPGSIEANNPPVRYDADTRTIVPDIDAPPGYHWARKPTGGFALKRNPNQSPNLPKLEFDAKRNRIIDPATGQVYLPPLGPGKRPTWQESEIEVGNQLGSGYTDQVSFKGGVKVPHGTPGSTRPDHYSPGPPPHSVEVKNYDVETPQGRQSLIREVTTQSIRRAKELKPTTTKQSVFIDVRGQNISQNTKDLIAKQIAAGSGGNIKVSDIEFIE